MGHFKFIFLFLSLLSYCSCEISYEKKNKLVNGFIDFYNSLPNQIYTCEEGYLQNAQQSTELNSYIIEVTLKVAEYHNIDSKKYLRCTGKVVDLDVVGVSVLNHHCDETSIDDKGGEVEEIVVTETSSKAAETPFVRKPVQLDNEVQTNTAVTSGEQFIAIPREEPKVSCIGCSSHVNPEAPGVSELASIGVRQLNALEPNVQHTLNSVVDVERQVQVVNGIRYILTLIIDYNSCLTPETDTCLDSKTCKVTFLEKPWMLLPDGSKYRAILANNCTKEWRFGDDGVVVPQTPGDSREKNNINSPQTDGRSDIIKPVHSVDVQAQPHIEKTLTDDDIKVIEDQIIPHKNFEEQQTESTLIPTSEPTETLELGKEHAVKVESDNQLSPNSIPATNSVKIENLTEDKKKAIDDMLSFFNFAGIESVPSNEEKGRMKRSFDNDLNVMNLVENFKKVKKNIENAKHVYKLAQNVVDYLNEIDIEVKTRVLKDVINAEEEFENHQHFYYIQSRVIIPCDKSECEEKDTIIKICNAVLDGTNANVRILNAFCHDEPTIKPLGKVNTVALDDPVLLKLVKEATDKIESESAYGKAMRVNKIIAANTQRVSGILTKFSILLDHTNCNRTEPLVVTKNCSVAEELGSQVCDVTVHERHWLKERKVTYVCTERPIDSSFSNIRNLGIKKNVNDPAVLDMANEALQYLDVQSNRNNKQIVVRVTSVTTQLVAGFLTDIEFVVGYTTCTNDVKQDNSKCKLLKDEPLRTCKAKIWDRTWIEDGRQVDVSCEEPKTKESKLPKRIKREMQFVGGPTNKDVNSPEIKALANDALRIYLKDSVYNRHFDILYIKRATVQVVAGTLTEIEFIITPTTCLIDREGYPGSSDCKIIDSKDVTTCTAKIWEKPWITFKDVNTTCHANNKNNREKREVPGGEREQNTNDPKYKVLAEESMRKYLQSNGNTEQHKVIKINRVTTQVVSGSKTRIYFVISPVDQTNSDVISCHSEIWEQPWLNKKEITVNCDIVQSKTKRETHESYTGRKLLNFEAEQTHQDLRVKTDNREKRELLGGETEKNTDDPKYKTLAEESMRKYLQSNGITKQHKVIKINRVTTQVVSGSKTRIYFVISPVDQTNTDVISCHSEIWEQPWLNKKEITVNCDIVQSKTKRETHKSYTGRKLLNFEAEQTHQDVKGNTDNREKRDTLVGGETDQNTNDPKYKVLAEESMRKYLQSNGNTKQHKVIKINRVTTQVVSGSKTRIYFVISPVDQTNSDVISCHSEIWEQPWLNKKEITVNCDIVQSKTKRETHESYTGRKLLNFEAEQTHQDLRVKTDNREKRELLGGETEKNTDDPKYKTLAEESMRKYLQSNGITKQHKVIKINRVTTQVVSGSKTRIYFVISPVDQTNTDVISCHSEIWEQPWLNKKEITVNCDIVQSKTKRETHKSYTGRKLLNFEAEQTHQDVKGNTDNREKRDTLVGGETDQNTNDPKYKVLAEESMRKYLQSNGNTKQHKVIKINRVTTQVVSGSKTRIYFVISPVDQTNSDVISCHSEIWEQPWLNKKEITVNCDIVQSKTKRETHESYTGRKLLNFEAEQTHQDLRVKTDNREKRELLGGETEKNTDDPKYKTLAEESMRKYLQSNGITKQHKVIKINRVTTQVVSGSKTRIYFVISPVDQTNTDVISCHSEIWEQPWLNKKEITVNCDIVQSKTKRETHESYTGRKLLNFEAEQTHQDLRVKTDNREKRELLGGETEKNTDDPKYKTLAEESMRKYLQSNGITKQHKVIKINRVTTQVVSGSKTRIYFVISPVDQTNTDVISCHSEIWEQPWLNKKEITVNCDIVQSKTKRETHKSYTGRKLLNFEAEQTHQDVKGNTDNREKRDTLVGGETDQNTNDPKYKVLAEESMRKYLQSNGNTKQHNVIKINRVTTQVVSGSKTRIYFVISPVDQTNSDVISCHSEIWEQPWLNKKEITVNCDIVQSKTKREVTHESYTGRKLLNFEAEQTHQDLRVKTDNREKRELLGGEREQNTNDPKYKALAEESMQKYLQSNGNTKQHKIIKINKVKTQVVSGSKTIIDFEISPVDQTNSDVISCHSEIWEQPWLNKKEITVNCGIEQSKTKKEILYDEQSRTKREILYDEHAIKSSNEENVLGGLQEHDPKKSQYRELARETLKKFFKTQKKSNVHKVVEVKKVTSRVVSGIMYYIEYIAAPAFCAKDISTCVSEKPVLHCYANVWDRPWLGKKEINVNCKANKKRKPRSLELRDVEDTFHQEEKKNQEEHREKRQTQSEEEYVDEDISFYYADLAIRHLNDQLRSNNLHKLVSIHSAQNSVHMNQPMVRMYIETAETYCLRHKDENILPECEELDGIAHRVCLARLWPSPDDELVVQQVNLVCDDDKNFESLTGLSVPAMLRASIKELEKSPSIKFKLVPQGEVQMTPSLDSSNPITLNFIVASTNCSKDIKLDIPEQNLYMYDCYIDLSRPTKGCQSYLWLAPNSKNIKNVVAECNEKISRKRRTVSLNPSNSTVDELIIQNMVQESLHKLEMASSHRYKQRVLKINSYSTKITSGKVTTIDFDVGYTSCLKFEWVDDLKTCEFLEHLPRKHCVSQVWERLWLHNGRNIEVTCEEDETPLEAHVEFESAETAKILANEALRHIEAKYPNPRKQKVVRIFSLEKQVVAGIHYRMKVEVGPTQCLALSAETNCILDKNSDNNKFCRVNVWLRPWTDHPPSFRVTCDYQEGAVSDMHHLLQAEQLFSDFLAMYKPEYINNASQMKRRFEIFRKNIRKIHELNTHEKGTATYGVTRFADLSYEEFSEKFLGLKPSLRDKNQVPMREAEIPDLQVPEKFDWREYGAVTEVKDQGSCGSCWAFSVTGNIEGQWKMQSGQLVSLSEQELVDCDKLDSGCNGGLPDNAYRAIEQLGGLELENDYPYEGEDDKCSFNKTMSKVQISGAVNITSNETDMAKWLVHNGPISIGINANAMQFYMGGVSHPWKMLCNPTNLDHGVLIVGYGVKDYPLFHKRLPYWTIKNSWGPGWGEKGYYRVYRGDGTCGVNQMASSAVI